MNRCRHKFIATAVITVSATCLTIALSALLSGHLLYNGTISAPRGFYWLTPATFQRHELVAFDPPASAARLIRQRNYLPPGAVLLKNIIAVANDQICTTSGELVASGISLGPIPTHDRLGRSLPKYETCGHVPTNLVYVGSSAPGSFDSRHFGPIPTTAIRGHAEPIWTW